MEAVDNPSIIIVFCRALNRTKKIKHLVLSSNNLRMANNNDVEGALESVVTVNLANCSKYSPNPFFIKCKAIFKRLCEDDKRIKDLDIMFNNLSHHDPDQLAIAATKLVRLNLGWTELDKRQVRCLFERLDETNNDLRELKMSGVDLSALDSRFLTSVVISPSPPT